KPLPRKAALSAPAEVPTRKSGSIPVSRTARSIPTCNAPRLDPPEKTNATGPGQRGRGTRIRARTGPEVTAPFALARASDRIRLSLPTQRGFCHGSANRGRGDQL